MVRVVNTKSNNTLYFLAQDHSKIEDDIDRLENALFNLRYEGKRSLGRNLKQVHAVALSFKTGLNGHFRLEEEALFPVAEKHLPKLETLIAHLKSEHASVNKHLETIEGTLKKLSRPKGDVYTGTDISILREAGMYLVYLLRSHMDAENKIVYKLIEEQLRPDEKNRITKRLSNLQCLKV